MSTRTGDNRRLVTYFLLFVAATIFTTMLTIALAQNGLVPGFEWDPAKWASDVSVFGGTIALITGFVRSKLWKTLDGIAVNAFTLVLGVAGGILLYQLNHFDTFMGGISHGIQAAIASWVMVEGSRRALNTTNPTANALAALTGSGTSNPVTDFILQTVKNLLPGKNLTAGLAAVAPLILELGQSETVLTDDRRFAIQRRVIQALRTAGFQGVDL